MEPAFLETHVAARPIRELGLRLAGTPLEPVLERYLGELERAGFRLRPRFYLSTEWGVAFGTIAIAIPFYLARPELAAIHVARTGMVEGAEPHDLLRYLRHEMGHVFNYAYKLYERPEWVRAFGAITQPYVEEYRPQPFSRRFVRHLPGWYAQKHPDEDWAETFAVWSTPGHDWRAEYADRPHALAKLALCDRLMDEARTAEPLVHDDGRDEEVGTIDTSLDELYRTEELAADDVPGLDGALGNIFVPRPPPPSGRDAAPLVRALEPSLCTEVYRWTGHFPERTRALMRRLGNRVHELGLGFEAPDEPRVTVALTALITALAMSHVAHGRYLP